MKSNRYQAGLGMLLMTVAGSGLLAACAEAEADKNPPIQQSETAAPDESTTDKAEPGTDTPRDPGQTNTQGDDKEATPRVACRLVTASSIPVWSAPSGGFVRCNFFAGDRFSHFGRVTATNRYVTWCPRGVPPAQGVESYAQGAGTVDGGCG